MLKTLTAATLAAAAAGVASLTLAAPALAQSPATHYYEQKVTGYTLADCNNAGYELSDSLQAQGYLVTFTGCYLGGGYPAYGGTVSWSD